MHYSNSAFAKNMEKHTITYRKNPWRRFSQRLYLTQTDIMQLNKLYQCPVLKLKKCVDVGSTHFNLQAKVRRQCLFHKMVGHCVRYRVMMQQLCAVTCGFCNPKCYDTSHFCPLYAASGWCTSTTLYYSAVMKKRCRKTCKMC